MYYIYFTLLQPNTNGAITFDRGNANVCRRIWALLTPFSWQHFVVQIPSDFSDSLNFKIIAAYWGHMTANDCSSSEGQRSRGDIFVRETEDHATLQNITHQIRYTKVWNEFIFLCKSRAELSSVYVYSIRFRKFETALILALLLQEVTIYHVEAGWVTSQIFGNVYRTVVLHRSSMLGETLFTARWALIFTVYQTRMPWWTCDVAVGLGLNLTHTDSVYGSTVKNWHN